MPRIVVITGASAGVGRTTALAFAAQGDAVALLARGREGLQAAAQEVRAAGGRALAIEVDVADAGAVEAAADRVERELGPIDVWVNNAMTAILAPVHVTRPEEFRRVTEVTYLGSVHGTLAALKHMRPRNRGHIVQVGSALGRRGIPLQATYCGAKHAVQGFFESLRTELRHQGSQIHLSIVQLPGLNTTQFGWVRLRSVDHEPQPVAPIYEPEVAARAIVWAAAHRRREIWVGVPTVYTILGNRLAPWLAEAYLARTGVSGQQTTTPVSPDRQDYLDQPQDRDVDRGRRGPFSDRALAHSPQLTLSLHRRLAWGLTAAAAGAVAAMTARRH